MKTRLIRIGNSRGVRIPKPLLERSGLGEEVGMEVQYGRIVIRSARWPRQGWAAAFTTLAESSDDALLDSCAPSGSSWDEEEWQW